MGRGQSRRLSGGGKSKAASQVGAEAGRPSSNTAGLVGVRGELWMIEV